MRGIAKFADVQVRRPARLRGVHDEPIRRIAHLLREQDAIDAEIATIVHLSRAK